MFQKHQFKDSFIITPPLITNSKVKFVRPISNQSTRSLLTSSKKSKSLSKIRKGPISHQSIKQPSIPSKYQRILSKPATKDRYDLKRLFNTEPGPGTYSIRREKPQRKTEPKSEPPGFDSGECRFQYDDNMDCRRVDAPGPGTYEGEKLK